MNKILYYLKNKKGYSEFTTIFILLIIFLVWFLFFNKRYIIVFLRNIGIL